MHKHLTNVTATIWMPAPNSPTLTNPQTSAHDFYGCALLRFVHPSSQTDLAAARMCHFDMLVPPPKLIEEDSEGSQPVIE